MKRRLWMSISDHSHRINGQARTHFVIKPARKTYSVSTESNVFCLERSCEDPNHSAVGSISNCPSHVDDSHSCGANSMSSLNRLPSKAPLSSSGLHQISVRAPLAKLAHVNHRDVRATAAFLLEDVLRLLFEEIHRMVKQQRWDERTPRSFRVAPFSHTACVLVSVCKHWRAVGLRTPRIWATIHLRWPYSHHAVDAPRPPVAADHAVAWADMHLERSMSLPLRISTMIFSLRMVQLAPTLIPRLLTQASRIESLVLEVWTATDDMCSEIVLQHLHTPFPMLRHLTLFCARYTVDSVLAILGNTPSLETLKLTGSQASPIGAGSLERTGVQVTLPHLHTLTLSDIDSAHFVPGQLLLTPSLVSLIWSAPQHPHAGPQLNAMSSAANLCPDWHSLRLERLYSDEQRGCIGTHVVPNLRKLAQITDLTIANSDVPDEVMASLGNQAAPLCPGLKRLVLAGNHYEDERNMNGLQMRLQMQGILDARLVDIVIDKPSMFDLLANHAGEAGCELHLLQPGSRV